ncbi:RNA-directed DNA polymerase, eukaryota [Tanacetum coccineum]
MVKDFRPISLIGSMYKIIAKILANQLILVISDLVSDVQSDFVSNLQILDGPFILNDLFSWCKRKNTKAMIFKVDFQKAFDSVRWDFLDEVLHKFGFGDKWRGDPLSPFLFILIMESLHFSFENVLNACLYKGIHLDDSLSLSHLFYADDIVFVVTSTASSIGCATLTFPFNYLGVKVGDVPHGLISSKSSSLSLLLVLIFFRLWEKKVGNGEETSFWDEDWTTDSSLKHMFPRLYLLELDKSCSVVVKVIDLSNIVHSSSRSSPWLDIIREFKTLSITSTNLFSLVKKVGNGDETFFWNDVWIADFSLKHLFPRLYSLELDKLCSVVVEVRDSSLVSSFRRPPRGGIEEDHLRLLGDIISSIGLSYSNDRWIWRLDSSGDFSVKSAHCSIDDSFLPKEEVSIRRIDSIPINVNIFAW